MTSKRVLLMVASACALVGALLVTSGYAFKSVERDFRVQRARFVHTTSKVSTSSKQFETIPGLNRLAILNKGPSILTFSGDVTGAAVEIQASADGKLMQPGVAHFDPASGTTSFTFTFMSDGGKAACRNFSLSWRSPAGEKASMNFGSMSVLYRFPRSHDGEICE